MRWQFKMLVHTAPFLCIIKREIYSDPKSENASPPKFPSEKESAITEALKYFRII